MITKKIKIQKLIKILKLQYPKATCFLNFKQPHELLIATRLSAQCTDKTVNFVTQNLFEKFDSIQKLAEAEFEQIYKIIKPCGMGNKKSNDIIKICNLLKNNFHCQIPNTMEQLLTLPGVGRKTANLVLATLFGKPAIIVDTHVMRISNRLGLVQSKNPTKVEFELLKYVPQNETVKLCHRLVQFGRTCCKARKPNCENCPVLNLCDNKQI